MDQINPLDIYLDFFSKDIVSIPCTQYDRDARTLIIHLLDKGKIFNLDSTKHILLFKMTKKDNTKILNEADINSDGTATYVITEQSCVYSGVYDIQFMLIDISDGTIIHTMPAKLSITQTVADNIQIESSNEFNALNNLFTDLQTKLYNHYFVLTEDKDIAGGVPSLDKNAKIPLNELYEATTTNKGITLLTDSVNSSSTTTAATPNSIKTVNDNLTSEISRATNAENNIQTELNTKAPLANPVLTGIPKAPTASAGTNTTQLATTEFVQTNTSDHNISNTAHSDIRDLISVLTTRLNALADSDDITLDQLSEIVAYIKSNRTLIENVTTNKVNVSDIVDNLISTAVNKPLSANQGRLLANGSARDDTKLPLSGGEIKGNLVVKKTSSTNSSGYIELEIKNDGKVSILRPDDSTISAKTDAAIYADKSYASDGSTQNDLVRINTDTLQFAGNHFLFTGSTTPNIGERLFEVSGELAQFYSHNGIRITNNTGAYGDDDPETRQQISMDVDGIADVEIKSGNGAIRLNSSVPLYKHEFFLSDGNTDSYWKHYNGFNKTLPASITLGDFLRIYNNKIRLGRNSSNNAIQYDLDVAGNYDTLELKCFKNGLDNTGIKLSGNSDDIKIKGNTVFYDVDNPNNTHTIEMTPSEHKIYSNTYNLNLQNLILIHDYNGYKVMYPNDSGQTDLGMTDRKWKNIYATNGVIQTSDRNEKNTIEDLTTEKAEALIYGLRPSTYKMNNGTSERTHWGIISQDVEELFEELGWSSQDFAGFIKSPKKVEIIENEVGNKLDEPIIDTIENEYSYSLRYDEFIAPLIKVVQEQNERILKLEEQLYSINKDTSRYE